MSPHVTRILALLGLLAAVPAASQARYLPQADTLFYEDLNPYRMYFVRGADTLGPAVRAFSIGRQVWRADGQGLRVDAREADLQLHGGTRSTVFQVTPRGVVRTIDGQENVKDGQFDLVLRLPADGGLREGRVWHDTIDHVAPVPGGEYVYHAVRELRVERMADTLDGRMAVVRGTGRLRYRHVEPLDSTATAFWWMDVSGPVDETFLFDVERGRMAAREWRMDLRGTSAFPGADGRMDTLPAGLLSMDTVRLVTAERARLVGRGLPQGDTSVTAAAQGDILLHTVRRSGAEVESGLRLNDWTTLTVRARHAGGRAVRYALLHTRPHEPPLERGVELADGVLRVTGDRDTALALPAGAWTVADYGLEEHLAPAIAHLALQGGREGEIHVLRPFTLQWDRARVSVVPVLDAFAAVVRVEPEGLRDVVAVLVVSRDGDLLYAEGQPPNESTRRPPDGSARARRVDRLLEAIRALAGEGG
ncbi:MAG TPA: hypothetical protein VF142_00655 [Longimicrobium sp.]